MRYPDRPIDLTEDPERIDISAGTNMFSYIGKYIPVTLGPANLSENRRRRRVANKAGLSHEEVAGLSQMWRNISHELERKERVGGARRSREEHPEKQRKLSNSWPTVRHADTWRLPGHHGA